MKSIELAEHALTSPRRLFERLDSGSYPWAFPLGLIFFGTVGYWILYYTTVDYDWLVEYQMTNLYAELPEQSKEMIRSGLTLPFQLSIAIVLSLIFIPVAYALQALYLHVVTTMRGLGGGYRKWLSAVAWSSMPVAVVLTIAILNVLMDSSGQITPDNANPLSVDYLLLQLPETHPLKMLASNFSLVTIWSIALLTYGYAKWTRTSIHSSLATVIVPYLVVVAGVALIA